MQTLLDGVDVTSQFGPADSSGTRTAIVTTPAINLGKNQLQISSGSLSANSSFFLTLLGAAAPSASLPLLVPIRTRVLSPNTDGSKATDYNIAIHTDPTNPSAQILIPASTPSDGSNTGFQVVYLSRLDLSVVSNVTVPNQTQPGGFSQGAFYSTITSPPPGCGTIGCLLAIQSLGKIGYTPCVNPDTSGGSYNAGDCYAFGSILNQLGLSARLPYANGSNPNVAFSSITNITANFSFHPGDFFESLTCSGSNYDPGAAPCDYLGYPNTSFTAPTNATPSQIGNISGALIRDNYSNYTFAQNAYDSYTSTQNASTARFAFATDPSGLSHTISVNGTDYPTSSLNGSKGGFHLLILNAKDLSVEQNVTFPSSKSGDASEVTQMTSMIDGYKSYGNLFFIAAFGNTTYNGASRSNWYQASQVMNQLGGTQQVFYMVNNPEMNPVALDDYSLVGSFEDGSLNTDPNPYPTGLESQYGAEMSSVISRATELNPLSSDMEGVLRINNQGFYAPTSTGHNIGLSTDTNAQLLSASLLSPTAWPYANDSGKQAAYNWISLQLCCTDIRSAYVNLNISPSIWLAKLQSLQYDPANIPNSTQADFSAMVEQLTTEFQYVELVRLFQSNVTGLYQDQQANISLLLQQDSSKVVENLQVELTTPAHPATWSVILNQVLGVASALSGFVPGGATVTNGVKTAIAVGSLIAAQAGAHTNTPAGSPLKAEENEEITVAQLAGTAADEFSNTLTSMGGEFDRIVSDWGRLKAMGAPLLGNQIPWDGNSAGQLLAAYDRLYQRDLYTKLLQANNVVQYMPYVGHTHVITGADQNNAGSTCDFPSYFKKYPALLWYPNGSGNYDPNDPNGTNPNGGQHLFPYDYQWGVYTAVDTSYQGEGCVGNKHDYTNTFGLFSPLDPGNPDALGAYPYWVYTRQGWKNVTNNQLTPCYDEGDC
jgi:hypothetical protein